MIIIDEVQKMHARGWSVETMMRRLGCERKAITAALWRLRNRKYIAEVQRKIGKRRYKTEEYRAWNRDRERRQYHVRKRYADEATR